MIAKITSKNQITIPKAILKGLQADYFEVKQENGRIILIPVGTNKADKIREKIAELGISEVDFLVSGDSDILEYPFILCFFSIHLRNRYR